MEENEKLGAARAMRRKILGDANVDAQTADPNPTLREFQDFTTSMAWGAWACDGAPSPLDRSLLAWRCGHPCGNRHRGLR